MDCCEFLLVITVALLFAGDEKVMEKKKKKKEKKKKKKKDKSRSRSRSREAVKLSSPNEHVSAEHNRNVLPLVHVKSEFPEELGNSIRDNRRHAQNQSDGRRSDVRVKENDRRRDVNSSNSLCQQRSFSPRRTHSKEGPHRKSDDKDRSRTLKTEVKGQDYRFDGKSSTKNHVQRTPEKCEQRDGREKQRGSSSDDGRDRRKSQTEKSFRTVDRHGHAQRQRSPDYRSVRPKRHGSHSSSDDDLALTRDRSPHGEQRQDDTDRDHIHRDAREHRHRTPR